MTTIRPLTTALVLTLALAACSQAGAPAAAPVTTATPAPAAAPVAPAVTEIKIAAGSYQLDPDHSGVLATWSHFGFSHPSAHFRISAGTVVWDAADPGKSSVEVTLPIAQIDTFVPALDTHLKSADFFDAGKFPNATFKSTGVQLAGPNHYTVTGNLTIKDKTHPVTLDVTLNGAGKHAMTGLETLGFSATAEVKRSDFGVAAFAPNVSDEVQLSITGEGSISAPAAAPAAAGK
ncbi:MAG: YceI family protein [Proteobacteria bacterium]|nr:YceI family protein [Pseudomonadota bacterium]